MVVVVVVAAFSLLHLFILYHQDPKTFIEEFQACIIGGIQDHLQPRLFFVDLDFFRGELQGGPLPIINGVINPINGLING